MKISAVFFTMFLSAAFVAADNNVLPQNDGWQSNNPSRNLPSDRKMSWSCKFKPGLPEWKVEYRDGAAGSISTENGILKIVKKNSSGYITVCRKKPVELPGNIVYQLSSSMKVSDAVPDYSLGMLRLLESPDDLACVKPEDHAGGPYLQFMFNLPENNWVRRLAHRKVIGKKGKSGVYPAIVIAGAPSTSYWQVFQIEPLKKAEKAFKAGFVKQTAPRYEKDMVPESVLLDKLKSSVDHTASVVRQNGVSRLLVDGKPAIPAIYKAVGKSFTETNHHSGKLAAQAGLNIQVITVRYGDWHRTSPDKYGVWSKDGFNLGGAVKLVGDAMRTSPDSLFVLTLVTIPYPEFVDNHPEEVWIAHNGKKVYGSHVHAVYDLKDEFPERYSYWASYHSKVWLNEVKKHTKALLDELKKSGMSKKIIGIHIAGGHDAQFALRHLDYSKPALEAYRNWLRRQYKNDSALQKAWGRTDVSLASVQAPDCFRKKSTDIFNPAQDQELIDFFRFQKISPFEMQEDLGRFVRRELGKDILLMRWCMAPFAGAFQGAMDITPFAESEVFDVLVAQSAYARRFPGIPHSLRLPQTSFHLNGKLFLQELDLRTWNTQISNESELRCLRLGIALDPEMWGSLNRRLTGQMIASRMGYWYYDMGIGWFDAPEIVSDLKKQTDCERELLKDIPSKWHPDAAFVIDEEKLFLRNLPAMYYIWDQDNVIAEQLQLLCTSGVPYDVLLMNDLLRNPELAKRYKLLVFGGMYHIDRKRADLLKMLKNNGRGMIFLSGTGRAGGFEHTGFRLKSSKAVEPKHAVMAAKGEKLNMLGWPQLRYDSMLLGRKPNRYYSSPVMIPETGASDKVPAVFQSNKSPAIVERKTGKSLTVYVAEAAGLTPEYFHRLAKQVNAYRVSTPGIQVDMNGNFMSIHGTRPGKHTINLPFACNVTNLKNGKNILENGKSFDMDVKAGATYWFRLTGRK